MDTFTSHYFHFRKKIYEIVYNACPDKFRRIDIMLTDAYYPIDNQETQQVMISFLLNDGVYSGHFFVDMNKLANSEDFNRAVFDMFDDWTTQIDAANKKESQVF